MARTEDSAPQRDAPLRVRQLVTGYGAARIVDEVDLVVGSGEVVVLIGPNGAGKSTVIKSIVGLVPPWQGEVLLGGEDVAGFPPERLARRGLAYVPQVANVFAGLHVFDNLLLGGHLLPRRQRRARAEELLSLFPALVPKRRQKVAELSGGQRQMLAMARALMTEPTLLLLDEPTAALSPKLAEELMEHIRQINRGGVEVLMVEQNAELALRFCDRAYVLANGRNEFEGRATEILDDAEMSRVFLGA